MKWETWNCWRNNGKESLHRQAGDLNQHSNSLMTMQIAMPNVPDHNSTSSEPITVEPVAADVISDLNSHNDSVQDLEITTPTLAPGAFNTSIENFDTYSTAQRQLNKHTRATRVRVY